ncbi:MAG: HAD family phosphatase [Candidatus Staskawiczbacteria bacterium]|jgi:putative hydrolase of the HAD superfamily
MIKAILFDYGGVLKNSHRLSDDIPAIYNISKEDVAKAREFTAPIFDLFQKELITEEDFWEKLSEAIKRPMPKDPGKFARESYAKSLILYPEIFSFVKELRAKGFKVAVLSNIIKFQAEIIRKNKGYEGFDEVVLSYEEKLAKPGIDIYLLTVNKLNVKPEECIFIDDKEINLMVARNLGMKTVLAGNPTQVINDVSSILNSGNT